MFLLLMHFQSWTNFIPSQYSIFSFLHLELASSSWNFQFLWKLNARDAMISLCSPISISIIISRFPFCFHQYQTFNLFFQGLIKSWNVIGKAIKFYVKLEKESHLVKFPSSFPLFLWKFFLTQPPKDLDFMENRKSSRTSHQSLYNKVMPFGLKNAGATYQRAMTILRLELWCTTSQ